MSFSENMAKVADELIRKYGSNIELLQNTKTGFDTITGKNIVTKVHHYTMGHVSNYSASDIVEGLIHIDDIKILIYSDGMDIKKDWEIVYKGEIYEIIDISTTTAQNENILFTIQGRGKNA